MPGRPVVELGCQVRFEGRPWTVAALADGQVRLVAEDGAVAAVLLPLLFADPGFELLDAPGVSRVPPLGLLESLPEAVRERALAWERHVREVETGRPGGLGAAASRRAEYDPQTRTLAQREKAKAAELSAAGAAAAAVERALSLRSVRVPVGVGSSLDDVAAKGEPGDDRRAETSGQ